MGKQEGVGHTFSALRVHAHMGEHGFSVTLRTSILCSKLPLQPDLPRKSHPTQTGCNLFNGLHKNAVGESVQCRMYSRRVAT